MGIMKMAVAETIYHCWKYRNDTSFGHTYDRDLVVNNIKDCIVYRSWHYRKYREIVAQLMM